MPQKYLNRHKEIAEELLEYFLTSPRERVLNLFLKSYFKSERKYGKRDRRQISDLVYTQILKQLLGLPQDPIEIYTYPEQLDPAEIAATNQSKFLDKLRSQKLSQNMTLEHIVRRMLTASRTFFYAPEITVEALAKCKVIEGVTSLPVGTSVQNVLGDTKYVIQDISSQKIWGHIPSVRNTAWDVCSGAGGKALMLAYQYPDVRLFCSDIRPKTLYNLVDRFEYMGLPVPEVFRADMTEAKTVLPFEEVETILADLPCSGSATWHRSLEQALVFETESLAQYASRQQQISAHALDFLSQGGVFVYVTCSYFSTENEEVVSKIKTDHNLNLQWQGMVDYYEYGGDALYMAVLQS